MSQTENHQTRPEGNQGVPRIEKIAWSLGTSADIAMGGFVGQVLMPVYNIAFGVSSSLVGLAVALPRFIDAFTDPIVGNFSDNTRTRWGRRKPYMLVGGLLSAVFFAAMWMPPLGWSPSAKFWFLIVLLCLYFPVVFAMFSIPQAALGYEMSGDYHERTRIMSYRAFFGALVSAGIPWFFWLARRPVFARTDGLGLPPEAYGVRLIGILVALLLATMILLPVIFCKERASAQEQDKIALFKAVRYTFTNRAFLIVGLLTWAVITARYLIDVLTPYVNIYYVAGGDKDFGTKLVGLGGSTYNIAGMAMIPGLVWLTGRLGKKRTLLLGEISALIATGLALVFFTPRHPYWQLPCLIMTVPGIQCVWILGNSMLADVCDADELASGLRREGMFGAAFLVMIKLAISTASLLSGFCLKLAGFKSGQPPTPEVVQNIRLMFVWIPSACLLIAILLTIFYPLTARRMGEIKVELEKAKRIETKGVSETEAEGTARAIAKENICADAK